MTDTRAAGALARLGGGTVGLAARFRRVGLWQAARHEAIERMSPARVSTGFAARRAAARLAFAVVVELDGLVQCDHARLRVQEKEKRRSAF